MWSGPINTFVTLRSCRGQILVRQGQSSPSLPLLALHQRMPLFIAPEWAVRSRMLLPQGLIGNAL